MSVVAAYVYGDGKRLREIDISAPASLELKAGEIVYPNGQTAGFKRIAIPAPSRRPIISALTPTPSSQSDQNGK